MKNTLLLLIVFLFIGGTAYYLTSKEDTKTTVLTEHRNFAVPNIDEVHKIFLADRNGRTITLVRKEDFWQLNNKWTANPNSIANLLHTIQKVKIKYVPPRAAVKHIVKDIATNHVKVEVYDQAGKKLKAYYVGGVTNDELGTHMIMEDADEPFVTYIPGFEGGLRARFFLKEQNWKDKTIFQERLEQIQAVSVEYPKQKDKSFKLEKIGDSYSVQPFYQDTPKINGEVKKGLAEKYLVGFERLVAEAYENDNVIRDSIEQQLPFCIVTVKTTDNQEKSMRLHPIVKKMKNGTVVLTEQGRPLIEKYFADVNGEDFMLIQYLVFGKILWSYDGFFG